jgi:hypothetical protein
MSTAAAEVIHKQPAAAAVRTISSTLTGSRDARRLGKLKSVGVRKKNFFDKRLFKKDL